MAIFQSAYAIISQTVSDMPRLLVLTISRKIAYR